MVTLKLCSNSDSFWCIVAGLWNDRNRFHSGAWWMIGFVDESTAVWSRYTYLLKKRMSKNSRSTLYTFVSGCGICSRLFEWENWHDIKRVKFYLLSKPRAGGSGRTGTISRGSSLTLKTGSKILVRELVPYWKGHIWPSWTNLHKIE